MNPKEGFIMTKRQKVTSGQVAEMTTWLRRLTPQEYQQRRGLLRRATDPECELGPKLLWPFKDKRPLQWNWKGVEREGALCEGCINVTRLELVPFHNAGENCVPGAEMLSRAADAKAFPGCQGWGQHAAEQLLERAAELPQEWARDGGPMILFPDTILLGGGGDRGVACLVWRGGSWRLGWGWLDLGFGRDCRFVRLRK